MILLVRNGSKVGHKCCIGKLFKNDFLFFYFSRTAVKEERFVRKKASGLVYLQRTLTGKCFINDNNDFFFKLRKMQTPVRFFEKADQPGVSPKHKSDSQRRGVTWI